MPDFDLTGELSLKIELHMLIPITQKVHSGNGPVSLVHTYYFLALYIVCSPPDGHTVKASGNSHVHIQTLKHRLMVPLHLSLRKSKSSMHCELSQTICVRRLTSFFKTVLKKLR